MNANLALHLRGLVLATQSVAGRRLAVAATIAVWLTLAIVVFSEIKQFTLWWQVIYLHQQGATPAILLDQMHPHFLRYSLVYPIFVAGGISGIPPDVFFSIACYILLFATFMAVRRLDAFLSRSPSVWANVWWSLLLCGLAVEMNGRGILAFFGYGLLLTSLVSLFSDDRPRWWLVISLPVAMLFCSVSSGVFSVAYLFVLVACIVAALRHREMACSFNTALLLLAGLGTLAFCWNFLIIGIDKNLAFYGGGIDAIWKMLSHGTGKILTLVNPLILIPAAFVLVLASLLVVWAARAFVPAVVVCGMAILAAMAGGIFGFTTLSVVVVPALAMMRLLFARPGHIVRQPPISSARLIAEHP